MAWGNNGSGQANVPIPNADFVAVAAGWWHSLGLRADGSIVAWGFNYWGQTIVPVPNTGFTAVASGYGHSLGLKADGSIAAWGVNGSGQTNVPAPNREFIAIAGGTEHSLGLKADGSIVAWGCRAWDYGQCNVPEPNTGFLAVAAGWYHSLGLKAGGSIVAWGDNEWGQIDVPSPNSGFVAVAAGGFHSLAIRREPLPCDLDTDRDADNEDFALFLASFGHSVGDLQYRTGADVDGDGTVTFLDYQAWLQCYREFLGNMSASVPRSGVLGDLDADGDVDLADFMDFQWCRANSPEMSLPCLAKFDFDGNRSVDLDDFAAFQVVFRGPQR